MRNISRIAVSLFVACMTVCNFGSPVRGQDYPNRPVTIVVPFAPGASTDTLARIFAPRLQAKLGQTVQVENRGGGGGLVGTQYAQRAKPDGYTLLFAVPSFTVNPALYSRPTYDPIKDFVPISQLASYDSVLVVSNALPAKTLREFMELAKKQPNTLKYATAGVGSGNHLVVAYFANATGLEFVHVPYKGIGEAMPDLIEGRVQFTIGTQSVMLGPIKSGQVRALAVTSPKRSPEYPDVPTVEEAGVKNFVTSGYFGLVAPAGTDSAIVDRLSRAIAEIYRDADYLKAVSDAQLVPVSSTPKAFGEFLQSDSLVKVARDANIRIPD